jgi:aromatic-L-amino-acid decarboxylase
VTDEAELEKINARLMEVVNASGMAYLSHAKIGDRYIIRLTIGNMDTREADVRLVWELLKEKAVAASTG